MTDRELLELAAKAAGIDAEWHNEEDADFYVEREGLWLKGRRGPSNSSYWNPLTDDGDALRLVVKIKWVPSRIEFEKLAVQDDPYDATRRAIVRAAAEIGRNMK